MARTGVLGSVAPALEDDMSRHLTADVGLDILGPPVLRAPPDPVVRPADARTVGGGVGEQGRRARQRERYGGISWSAGFFGWLVTLAMSVLACGVVAAAVTALAGAPVLVALMTDPNSPGPRAAILAGVLMSSYYAGGYVAGRMSRFDGVKQGLGVWLTGLVMLCTAVGLGLASGLRTGLFDWAHLFRLLAGVEAYGTRDAIVAGAVLLGSLIVAGLGGGIGCRYHRKVDGA
jgi:hypothetical protein